MMLFAVVTLTLDDVRCLMRDLNARVVDVKNRGVVGNFLVDEILETREFKHDI